MEPGVTRAFIANRARPPATTDATGSPPLPNASRKYMRVEPRGVARAFPLNMFKVKARVTVVRLPLCA